MKKKKNTNTDFSKLLEGLDKKWVILSKDSEKVIAFSDTLDDIADKLSKGILIKVPDSTAYLSPSTL